MVGVAQVASADEMNCTFVLNNEDHTLGNSVRYMIARNRETEFVGYSIPHPSDKCVNMRVQSKGGCLTLQGTLRSRPHARDAGRVPSVDLLREGLQNLVAVCDEIRVTYDAAVEAHKEAAASMDA